MNLYGKNFEIGFNAGLQQGLLGNSSGQRGSVSENQPQEKNFGDVWSGNITPMTPAQRAAMVGAINAKEQWTDSKRKYDALQTQLDAAKDDETRKKISESMNPLQVAMDTSKNMADYYRGMGKYYGGDPSQYGSDVTLKDARLALARNDFEAIQNALYGKYGKTSDDVFNENYEKFRGQGFSKARATDVAGRLAAKYQSERVAALNQAYNTYGRTGDVNNSVGVQLLNALAYERPDLAQMNKSDYPGVKDEYNLKNTVNLAQLQHDLGLENKQMAAMLDMNLEQYKQLKNDERQIAKLNTDKERTLIQEQGRNNRQQSQNQTTLAAAAIRKSGGNGNGRKEDNQPTPPKELTKGLNLFNNAKSNPTPEVIEELEDWITENATSLDPQIYNEVRHFANIVRGQEAKSRGDDSAAFEYWSKVPAEILDNYISENVDGIKKFQKEKGLPTR